MALLSGSIEQGDGRWQAARARRARSRSVTEKAGLAPAPKRFERWIGRVRRVNGSAGLVIAGLCAARGLGRALRRSCLRALVALRALGFAGLAVAAAALSSAFGAASGLALACLTAAGLAAVWVLASLPASLPPSSAAAFGAAAASGFFAATCDFFFPRCRGVCFSLSAATAAISAAPVLVGPV